MSHKLKVLGLSCLAVFAFTAVSASAAQAHEWTITGTPLSSLGGTETIDSVGGPFELSVPSRKLLLRCEEQVSTGEITSEPEGSDSALVEFFDCSVVGAPLCEVEEPIVAETVTQLVTVNGVLYDRFSPAAGSTFTTIVIEGCAAEGEFPVTGNVAGETEPPGVQLVDQPLDFSKEISEAAGTELKFGNAPAFLSGEAEVTLTGPNAGEPWGAN
jgi:hypothetical protein